MQVRYGDRLEHNPRRLGMPRRVTPVEALRNLRPSAYDLLDEEGRAHLRPPRAEPVAAQETGRVALTPREQLMAIEPPELPLDVPITIEH